MHLIQRSHSHRRDSPLLLSHQYRSCKVPGQPFRSASLNRASAYTHAAPVMSGHPNHGFYRGPLLRILGGPINLFQVVELHQAVEGEATLIVELDQAWDKDVRDCVALDDSAHRPTRDEDIVHVQAGLGTERRGTDQPAHADRRQAVHRLAEYRGYRGRLQGIIRAPAGDPTDLLHRIGLGAVYSMRSTQLPRQLQATGLHVDTYDDRTSGDGRRHDGAHADRARSEDRDAGASLGAQGVQDAPPRRSER